MAKKTPIEKQIEAVYNAATKEAAKIGISLPNFDPDRPFDTKNYPQTKKKLDAIVKTLSEQVEIIIERGIDEEWLRANDNNDELCRTVFSPAAYNIAQKALKEGGNEKLTKYFDRNEKARDAFKIRTINGMNLSDRVWKYSEQYKQQIEMSIDMALRDGVSAAEMSRELKQYLNEPNKLFRRVRDEHGILRLSKNAKAYHPGQGVYRSSHKNAMRLARTETNLAYRYADYERWKDMDFVVGIEVKLSNNHTINGVPFTDMCDTLKGKYPKDFKFGGWHTQCRCYATTILKTADEMSADDELILADKEPTDWRNSKNAIKDTPSNYKKWVKDNEERIARAKSMPYFLKDNKGYMDSALGVVPPKKSKTIFKTDAQKQAIQEAWDMRKRKNAIEAARVKRHAERDADAIQSAWEARRLAKSTDSAADLAARKQRIEQAPIDRHAKRYEAAILEALEKRRLYNQYLDDGLRSEGKYLQGEKYVFDRDFFALIDVNNSPKLNIIYANKVSHFSPSSNAVYIFSKQRNIRSPHYNKSVIYHEFGHAIDQQRGLRTSKELLELRSKQLKMLNKKSQYKVWERKWNDQKGWINIKTTKSMSLIEYIDARTQETLQRLMNIDEKYFAKRGVTKADITEQFCSMLDTIMSFNPKYGYGHTKAYWKRPGMKEAEYLAHAFENAFSGNPIFKKFLPEIYEEMIDYIKQLE